MNCYSYEGPVERFGKCIDICWKSTTYAISERKARSNLAYQYKKQNNLNPRAQITLPGRLVMIVDAAS